MFLAACLLFSFISSTTYFTFILPSSSSLGLAQIRLDVSSKLTHARPFSFIYFHFCTAFICWFPKITFHFFFFSSPLFPRLLSALRLTPSTQTAHDRRNIQSPPRLRAQQRKPTQPNGFYNNEGIFETVQEWSSSFSSTTWSHFLRLRHTTLPSSSPNHERWQRCQTGTETCANARWIVCGLLGVDPISCWVAGLKPALVGISKK